MNRNEFPNMANIPVHVYVKKSIEINFIKICSRRRPRRRGRRLEQENDLVAYVGN
jgi:hypothetical protein